jgi:nucleotide-binding universal stress UspA family protein
MFALWREEEAVTRYLVAYDGSAPAREAVARVAALYREGDVVGVVSVSQGPAGGTQLNDPDYDAALHQAESDDLAALLAVNGIAAVTITASGHPASAICAAATEGGFDVIVVGSRNVHGPRRLVLGSVSSGVVNHADCDVLVVKGPRS